MKRKPSSKILHIYTDGACKGNPGIAGAGVIIKTPTGDILKEFSFFLGQTTNNIAEYKALLIALKKALHLKADIIYIYSDSQLMVQQLKGIYNVKNKRLKILWDQAMKLLKSFKKYDIFYINREENKEADRLANQAIKKKMKGLLK